MKPNIFTKQSKIEAPIEELFRWHGRPGAIERLSPPWDPLQVISSSGGIEEGAEVQLRLKMGPFPYSWRARHTKYVENVLFRDEEIAGPFSRWIHTHRFTASGDNACYLQDEIDFKLPFHPFRDSLSSLLVHKKLERIFRFRHICTAQDIKQQLSVPNRYPRNILISGASGVIGSALVPFLTTAGHRVIRLRRDVVRNRDEERFWDPSAGKLDPKDLEGIDAVIHLAGEPIGEGVWTVRKKERIINSRNSGTRLLAETMAKMAQPPRTFISASAIGYYGNRGDQTLSELDSPGDDFVSSVCQQWEAAAHPAEKQGIRTLFLRIGVVLDPSGGALSRLLLPFQLGLGAKMSSGRQYTSWIGLDDVIGSIYHLLHYESITGPVNLTAPEPVTNSVLTRMLASALSRPAVLTIPELMITTMFGQMGREILLSGSRVLPTILLESGYAFRHPKPDELLYYVLGKEIP
ncbi:MAG: TIGR01777 family protein [SAR324 cluster bacterium]|nr:TIGR01777 family protein [SAR324 cluster bacterium]